MSTSEGPEIPRHWENSSSVLRDITWLVTTTFCASEKLQFNTSKSTWQEKSKAWQWEGKKCQYNENHDPKHARKASFPRPYPMAQALVLMALSPHSWNFINASQYWCYPTQWNQGGWVNNHFESQLFKTVGYSSWAIVCWFDGNFGACSL